MRVERERERGEKARGQMKGYRYSKKRVIR